MWVLSPLVAASSQHAVEEGTLPNPVQFLVAGSITIGRPLKKGGTTGKANLLIFGESSVSSLHAVLTVKPAEGGAHGSVTVTDDSKYGTFVRQSNGDAPEQRIPAKEPFHLQQGDVLRFGTKCRYKLQQVAVTLCTAGTAAADPELATAAAACNVTLVTTCTDAAVTHCVASEGDQLTPAVLYCLVNKIPVVTPAWVAAVAAGKVHPHRLPDADQYAPKQLQLPQLQDLQQQQLTVDVLQWQRPVDKFLERYVFIFTQGHQPDLVSAVSQFCHKTVIKPASVPKNEPVSEAQHVAVRSLSAVLVVPISTPAAAATALDPATITVVTEQQLLYVLATGDVSLVQAAAETCQQLQQQRKAEQIAALAAVDADDVTESDETEEGGDHDDGISHELLHAVTPDVHGSKRRQQQQQNTTPGRQWKGKSPAKSPAVKQPLQLQTSTTDGNKGSKRTAAAMQQQTAKASTPGRKRRRTAAAAAAADDGLEFEEDVQQPAAVVQNPAAVTPAVGREAAMAAWHKGNAPSAALTQQQQQQGNAAAPTGGPSAAGGAAYTAPNDPAAAAAVAGLPQLEEGIYMAPLVVAQPAAAAAAAATASTTAAAAAAAGGGSRQPVVNFKAFRRKENLPGYPSAAVQQQQQHKNGKQQQHQAAAPVIGLQPFDTGARGVDTDAFLREERARLDRLKEADDLFNANLRPKTAVVKPAKPPLAGKRKAR